MSTKKETIKRLYRYTFNTTLLLVSYTILNVTKETQNLYYLDNGQHIDPSSVYDYYVDPKDKYGYVRLEELYRPNGRGYVYSVRPMTAKLRKEILEGYIKDLDYRFKAEQYNAENYLKRSEEAANAANEYVKEINRVKDFVKKHRISK